MESNADDLLTTVPSPRQATESSSTRSLDLSYSSLPASPAAHIRRPSLSAAPPLRSTSPSRTLPVPRRQGSITHNTSLRKDRLSSPENGGTASLKNRGHVRELSSTSSISLGSSLLLSTSLSSPSPLQEQEEFSIRRAFSEKRSSRRDAGVKQNLSELAVEHTSDLLTSSTHWLSITAHEILLNPDDKNAFRMVVGAMGMEEAVEVLLSSKSSCLLVRTSAGYSFFDFADLNTFLLLVLHATSSTPRGGKSTDLKADKPPHSQTNSSLEPVMTEDENISENRLMDQRSREIVRRLRRGEKVKIESVCDISQKNPYHSFPDDTPISSLLPVFASGVHRLAIDTGTGSPPQILSSSVLLEHLLTLPPDTVPSIFNLEITSPDIELELHALVSLPGTASVLDAMQVMSHYGLSALGVLSGSGRASHARRESTGSGGSSLGGSSQHNLNLFPRTSSSTALTGSPLLIPALSPGLEALPSPLDIVAGSTAGTGELVSIVTVGDCARLVIPSEGKQVLGMGLEKMSKRLQVLEGGGRNRGEEKVPVHTISLDSTLLYACHLILATSSSRVFLRRFQTDSPPLSPTPSLTMSQTSTPTSPSLSSLSLSDPRPTIPLPITNALPAPPPTQLSPHYVISILDILSAVAKAYRPKLSPLSPLGPKSDFGLIFSPEGRLENDPAADWDLDPTSMGKRRRASSSAGSGNAASGQGVGFETWRWTGKMGRG